MSTPPLPAPPPPFFYRRPSAHTILPPALLLLFITAARLWMTSAQRLWVMNGPHDDLLFLRAAESILHFKWLGPYNEMTLIKGPGYPLFVAFVYILHIPLLLAQQLYYALTCLILLIAVRPAIRSIWLLSLIYAFLLMNPVMTSMGNWTVLREGIYAGQSLLVAATLIGMVLRVNAPIFVQTLWAVAAGYALGAVMITREEGAWLVPYAAIILVWIAWKLWRQRRIAGRFTWLRVAGLPVAITGAIILTICTINYFVYNTFCVVELKEPQFVSAMAAMQRVEPPHFHRLVPVTKETRQLLYDVSPTFAKLKPILDGQQGKDWASFGDSLTELHGSGEIGGSWYIWAFRQAAAKIGMYRNSATARAFYKQIALEINTAVDDGRLKASPLHNTLAAPWRAEYGPLMIQHAHTLLHELFALQQDEPQPMIYQSSGSTSTLQHFEHFTHESALPNTPDAALKAANELYVSRRIKTLRWLRGFYGTLLQPLGYVALAATLCMLLIPSLRRRSMWALVALAGIVAATLIRCALLLYIDVSLFRAAADPRYLGPAETYLMLAEILALTAALSAAMDWWKSRRLPTYSSSPAAAGSLPTAIDAASTPAS